MIAAKHAAGQPTTILVAHNKGKQKSRRKNTTGELAPARHVPRAATRGSETRVKIYHVTRCW